MIETLAQTGLQNVYTPLPFNVHLIFCIIATVVYVLQYTRKKAPYYLLIMAAIDATFITQFCTKSIVIALLFAVEVVLLVMAGVSSYMFNKAKKAANSESVKASGEKTDENSNS